MGNPQNSLVDFTEAMYDKKSDSQNDRETQENLRVSSLTHKQTKRKDTFILQDVEFDTTLKSFTAVTGVVGSGKIDSTLGNRWRVVKREWNNFFRGTFVYVP